jgi:hypothetical protein
MAAVFSGQAVGGIFASGTNVVVLALGASPSDVRDRKCEGSREDGKC